MVWYWVKTDLKNWHDRQIWWCFLFYWHFFRHQWIFVHSLVSYTSVGICVWVSHLQVQHTTVWTVIRQPFLAVSVTSRCTALLSRLHTALSWVQSQSPSTQDVPEPEQKCVCCLNLKRVLQFVHLPSTLTTCVQYKQDALKENISTVHSRDSNYVSIKTYLNVVY